MSAAAVYLFEPGHALGSLTTAEAARFAAHVDAYLSVPVGAG